MPIENMTAIVSPGQWKLRAKIVLHEIQRAYFPKLNIFKTPKVLAGQHH